MLMRNASVWKCVEAYILPIECPLIAPDASMFSHKGYGSKIKDQGPKAAGPGPGGAQDNENLCVCIRV